MYNAGLQKEQLLKIILNNYYRKKSTAQLTTPSSPTKCDDYIKLKTEKKITQAYTTVVIVADDLTT